MNATLQKCWLVDAALFAGFLACFFPNLTGVGLHQWPGLAAGGGARIPTTAGAMSTAMPTGAAAWASARVNLIGAMSLSRLVQTMRGGPAWASASSG